MIPKGDHFKAVLTKSRLEMVSKLILEDTKNIYSSQRGVHGSCWHLPSYIIHVAIEASARNLGVNEMSYIESPRVSGRSVNHHA
jgi:hypothetical protein